MITPMRKYAFLVHYADYNAFLEDLRDLGVLHVKPRLDVNIADMGERAQERKEIVATIRLLERRTAPQISDGQPQPEPNGIALAREIRELQEEIDRGKHQLNLFDKEAAALANWGDFSLETIANLSAAGWELHFYTCPIRKYQSQWENDYYLSVISQNPPDLYFVVFTRAGEPVELEAEELPLPTRDPAGLRLARLQTEARLNEIEQTLDRYAGLYLPLLAQTQAGIDEASDWQQVLAFTNSAAEEQVNVLEGFVPVTKEKALVEACERRKILFLADRPAADETPPILLENKSFSRLFEPIGGLYSLPGYGELDLTPFFAPFFMMFFGFCLGDAGYGLVLLLGAALYKPKASKDMRPILTLLQFLSVATIFFGLLGGTVFGVSLLGKEFSWLGKIQEFMLDSNQIFTLALALGVVQIIFGLFLQGINRMRQSGFLASLPPFGWIILLLSLLDIGYLKLMGPIATYTSWLGVALIMFFSDMQLGILGRIGKGLWDLYGITGFFGDLLSYIRLFALGMSSAILGFVINTISLQIKDSIPILGPILFVIFLIVGHGANMLIAMLGSFVHPMRLTFVEFYKNAGFAGGGKAYAPFSRKKQEAKHQNAT